MDEYGAGPLLRWLHEVIARAPVAVGLPELPGALILSHLVFGVLVALLGWPLRLRWMRVRDRIVSLTPAARALWRRSGRRPRPFGRDVRQALADVGVRPRALLRGPLWWLYVVLAVWATIAPWGQTPFRRAVGQNKPNFGGRSFSTTFTPGDDLVLTAVTLALTLALAGLVSRALRAALVRRRYLLSRPPRTTWWLGRLVAFALAGVAVWWLAGWNPRMGYPWASAVLLAGFGPMLWSWAVLDRGRAPQVATIPSWVWMPAATTPPATRPAEAPAAPGGRPLLTSPTRAMPVVTDRGRTAPLSSRWEGSVVTDRAPTQLIGADRAPTQVIGADRAPTQVIGADRAPTQLLGHHDPAAAPTRFAPRHGGTGAGHRHADLDGRAFSPDRLAGPGARTAGWRDLAAPVTRLAPHEPRQIGPWTVLGRIGAGGMAIVYLARDRAGREVALKVANPLLSAEVQAPTRLLREIQALSRVGGAQVVRVIDVGIDHEHPWIAMDYLAGPSLNQAVKTLGPVPEADRLRQLAGGLAVALESIHAAGVTHRDLKPHNVMVTDQGPVVVDLGIARLADGGAALTQTGLALGSLGYVAPELLLGNARGVDSRVDVWSWGACVAFAASGRTLFAASTAGAALTAVVDERRDPAVMDALARLDHDLARLVWDCTRADPNERPGDGAVLRRVLPGGLGRPRPW